MSTTDDVIEALRAGAYRQADAILATSGAAKRNVAPKLRLLWALTRAMRRNLREAVDVLTEVCGRDTRSGEAVYQKLQRLVGSLNTLLPPAGAQEIRLRIGDYFLRAEKPEEAMLWLGDAHAAHPDDPLASYLEANCRFALYGERRALRDMELALPQAAADAARGYFIIGGAAALWYRLGAAHEHVTNLEEAARFLAKSVELTPENSGNFAPRLLLGHVLIRLGRFDEAIAQLDPIPPGAENYSYALRYRAVAFSSIGDPEMALALLREAAEIDPLGAPIFLEEGRVHLATDNLEGAEMALARAFRTDPDLPGLKSAMIALEQRLGRIMDPDAGLPAPDTFDIPEEFVLRLDDPAIGKRARLRDGLSSHLSLIRTIMLREMLKKGQKGMGYAGMLLEPLAWVVAIDIAWHLRDHTAKHGVTLEAFLISGLAPYFLFYAHVLGKVSSAVTGNTNLLHFRRVTPLILIVANLLREFLTALIAYVVIVGGLGLFQSNPQIADPLTILVAVAGMSMLAAIGGVLFGLGQLAIPWLHLVQMFYMRLMFIFSGCFFFANDLPPQMAYYASFNPLLELIEFVREAFFRQYQSRYAMWEYPLVFIIVGMVLILVLERATRRYLAAA
jgi:capsular polysaccharide transport system permease protein